MPLYEYRCTTCGHIFEKIQSFSAPDEKECPRCGGPVERLISAPAIQFKGSGFYLTDYGKSGGAKSGNPASGGSSGESSSGGKSESGGSSSSNSGGSSGSGSGAGGSSSTGGGSSSSGNSGSSGTSSTPSKS